MVFSVSRHCAGLVALGLSLLLPACGGGGGWGGVKAPDRWNHRFVWGQTAFLHPNGKASAPPQAPAAVQRAVAAANEIAGAPYKWGGGHASLRDSGYDCSGTTSYVLNRAGLMRGTGASEAFLRYGEAGPGKWITVYAKDGHVFLDIAGLRFDTGGASNGETGPQWKTQSRKTKGFYLRHPSGL